MSVSLDTVGLLAIWNRKDQWHDAATAAFKRLVDACQPLVTTDLVFMECGNAAARYPFRSSVVALREQLAATEMLLLLDGGEVQEAWDAYARGEYDQAGIVDQCSFIVMRREGLTQAFTNDHHFHAAGFETLF